jgi:hypothetical protein
MNSLSFIHSGNSAYARVRCFCTVGRFGDEAGSCFTSTRKDCGGCRCVRDEDIVGCVSQRELSRKIVNTCRGRLNSRPTWSTNGPAQSCGPVKFGIGLRKVPCEWLAVTQFVSFRQLTLLFHATLTAARVSLKYASVASKSHFLIVSTHLVIYLGGV